MNWALHGNLGRPEDWRAIPGLDAPDAPLQAPDLWAGLRKRPLNLEAWATAFCQEVRERDATPFLMGYSLGGRLALHALLAAPDLWQGGVLVSVHPGLESEIEREERLEMDLKWAADARSECWEDFVQAWNKQGVFAGDSERPETFDRVRSLESQREFIALAFDLWSLGRQEPLAQRLAVFEKPVLWLTGERDPKFTALARSVAVSHPSIDHQVVPGSGHRLLVEDPAGVGRRIQDFQRRNL